jgi:hypothetical protein
MREAIERLLAEKILFHRPTKFQLKADDLSLWPNTGTIFRDEDDAILPERGIEDLIRLLRPKRRSATDDGGAPPHLNLLIDQ